MINKVTKAIGLFILIVGSLPTYTHAQSYQVTRYKLESIFMYNFSKYIEWPNATPQSEFVIGVIGPEVLGQELERMAAAKSTNGRNYVVRQLNSAEEATNVHILLIEGEASAADAPALMRLRSQHTLVVTTAQGGMPTNSCINLSTTAKGKIQYELNQAEINHRGLKVSGNLLNLAKKN